MSSFSIGIYQVSVKYFHQPRPNKTIYFRRGIPKELRSFFGEKPYYVRSTGTNDPVKATKELERINKQYEQEIKRARLGLSDEGSSMVELSAVRKEMEGYGLTVLGQGNSQQRSLLQDALIDKVYRYDPVKANTVDEQEVDELISQALNPIEARVYEILRYGLTLKVSEYIEPYLELKGKQDNRKFKNDLLKAVELFTEVLGNNAPGDYLRTDLNRLIAHWSRSVKSNTVHKRLGLLRAMFNLVNLEYEVKESHPFHDWKIPEFKEDSITREDFTSEQLNTILCTVKPVDEIGRLILVMLNTGMRVNEVLGLRREDLVLNGDAPYVLIQKNPFRRLKTKNSQRFVPLVKEAYEALSTMEGEGEWLFMRYFNRAENRFNNDSASNAINKRLRSMLGDGSPTAHSFRHTITTLLRNADCPKDVREELLGWRSSVSDHYGTPTDIKKKADFIERAVALYRS